MVSFIVLLKKLLPGDYYTGFGYPGSEDDHESFVREVKKRVPEVAHEEDRKVEEMVNEAIEWAVNNICKPLGHRVKRGVNRLHEVGLFQCHHPEIGTFYLTFDEESNGDAGTWHFGFTLRRSREEAERDYREAVGEMEEEEEEEEEVW